MSTHRHDREYLRVSTFDVKSDSSLLLIPHADIAQVDPTLISTIAHRATLAMSLRACVPSELVMTHTNKRVVASSS